MTFINGEWTALNPKISLQIEEAIKKKLTEVEIFLNGVVDGIACLNEMVYKRVDNQGVVIEPFESLYFNPKHE